ncbi:MAG: AAA family ATPase [Bacteroides sp.]|nr:AAA family ATPase [Bacteroides sp.]
MEKVTTTDHSTTEKLEKAVVCSLLMEQHNLPDVTGWLTPEMFLNPDTGFIYQAILAQYEEGKKPDYRTTEARMRRMDAEHCRRIGGMNFLADSIPLLRHNGNMHDYAEEIKRLYTLRVLEKIMHEGMAKATSPETDPEELIAKVDRQLLQVQEKYQVSPPLKKVGELIEEVIEIHEERVYGNAKESSILTGIFGLNHLFGGLQSGELYVLGGRPGDGKTAIGLEIAIGAAQLGKEVCFFSMEMNNLQAMNRILTGHLGMNGKSLRISNLRDADFQKMMRFRKSWENLPFHMDYSPGNSVAHIRSKILLQKKRKGCNLVVIDYLHLLISKSRNGETPDQIVDRNILALKRLALEANCAVLVLSQMNRQSESRSDKNFKPNLSDLRDSGVIEQAADGVMFIYRSDRHGITHDPDTNECLKGTCDLIIRKNRNGDIGIIRLRHNGSFTRFKDAGEGELLS